MTALDGMETASSAGAVGRPVTHVCLKSRAIWRCVRERLAGQLAATSWQPVGAAFGAGVAEQASYQQQQQPQPVDNQLAQPSYPASQLGYPAYQDLNGRVSRLENEYQHSLIQRNSPGGILGLDKNTLIIIVAIGLLIYFVSEQQRASRVCPTVEGNSKAPAKSKGMGNIGDKVVTKFTDRFVSKAADSLFK